MSTIKTHIAQVMRIFGIVALVAAFAATAFPAPSFAATASVGKLTVTVYKQSPMTTINPPSLAGTTVEVINARGLTISKAVTGEAGRVTLELPKGAYKIRMSAPGYNTATGSTVIEPQATVELEFVLRPTAVPTLH